MISCPVPMKTVDWFLIQVYTIFLIRCNNIWINLLALFLLNILSSAILKVLPLRDEHAKVMPSGSPILAFPVFLHAKRMDWYILAFCERNRTVERNSEDERTHHNTRHPTQWTRRSGHVMGGDASDAGNSRAVLALNSAG